MKELKLLLPFITKYKYILILGFIFVTISNICSTYAPRVVGNAVDYFTLESFQSNDIWNYIWLFLGLTAGSGFFMFLTRKTIIVVSRYIEHDLRQSFLLKIESLPMNFFVNNPTGSIMAYVTNDIAAAREFFGPAIMYAANTITTFFFALYFMLTLNIEMTFAVFFTLPLITIAVYVIGKKVHLAFKNLQQQYAVLTADAQEAFSGIRIVRAYNRQEHEYEEFKNLSKDYLFKNLKLARLQTLTFPLLMILVGASQLIVLSYGGHKVIEGELSIGVLTQFFIYLNLLIWPVAAIGWITNVVQRAAASAGRLNKIFIEIPETNLAQNDKKITSGSIEFEDLSLEYNEQYRALENINLSIKAGTQLGIIGTIGSGKTSIANLISGLFSKTSGKISIDGIDLDSYSLSELRNSIAVVQQDTFLFSTTIAENIRFGKPDATDDELVEFAKLAELHNDILAFPKAYETQLGERGITLSGGQKQRLAIARALIKKPIILILDDALSAVDTETQIKIIRSIKGYLKNRTSIIISHNLSVIQSSDNIIMLVQGRIIEQGKHSELINQNGRYAAIYRKQQLANEIERI